MINSDIDSRGFLMVILSEFCYFCAEMANCIFRLKRKDVGMLPRLFIGVAVYYVWFQSFYNKIAFNDIFPYIDAEGLIIGIALNFIPISTLAILMWTVVYGVHTTSLSLKIAIDAIGCSLALIMVNFIFLVVLRALGYGEMASVNWAGTIFNAFFIFLGIEVVYWIFSFNRQRLKAIGREKNMLRYKYEALAAQVNPHFLFNSLGTLSAMIKPDNEPALRFIKGLSDIYHYVLINGNQPTVSLEDELSLLDSYVKTLSHRYGSKLEVKIEKHDGISLSNRLIPFTFQMLVENVLRHNIISAHCPLRIDVVVESKGIRVINPERPRGNTKGHGFSLSYLHERYSDMGSSFSVERKDGNFVASACFVR